MVQARGLRIKPLLMYPLFKYSLSCGMLCPVRGNSLKLDQHHLYSSRHNNSKKDDRAPSRLRHIHELMEQAENRASCASDPPPRVSLENVNMTFSRSSGPGGQNVNKLNTKVDMRFKVKNASWLSERMKEKIMQMEKNRINKFGEIVISSSSSRTQRDNIEDALRKLQEIIDAAAHVPPPPSDDQKKKIARLAAVEEQKRLQNKKAHSSKKASRREQNKWD